MPLPVDCDERERRACHGVAGRTQLGLRMLDRSQRRRPGLVELACEVQGACQGRERGDEHVVGVRGELDRAAAGGHRLADVAVDRGGAHHPRYGLDIRADAFRVLRACAIREVEEAALLEGALTRHQGRRRRPDGDHGMLDELLVGQRAHPAEQRPGAVPL